METFHAGNRLVDSEWLRRMRSAGRLLREIAAKKRAVRRHYGRRFYGAALEEWVRHLFDLRMARLEACRKTSAANARDAKLRYAGQV